MPVENSDIFRLLTEIMPQLEGDDAIREWLKREGITGEAWSKLGDDIVEIVCGDIMENYKEPLAGISAMQAGIQLAFFVGWECSKEYAPRRDMSQKKKGK